jgi:demethylmenaquinone methyltransferase/2-methoxy-6-polyprenyl-1,4-benzoquinol methylase
MTKDLDDHEPEVLRVFQSKDQIKAYYNKIARAYDLLAEHSEQPIRAKGLASLSTRPGERVLEIGFGTGHCLVELARAVGAEGKVYGIDISASMMSLSRDLLKKADLDQRVKLICGDAEHMPYPDDSLDGIFTSFTLELFDTPAIPAVLVECRRVLRPGGRLVVVALSKEGKQGLMLKAYEWTHRHFPNLMDCRPIYAQRSMAAAGFDVAATEIAHMWVPVEIVHAIKPK